jgi:ribose-phosphate pyrophosphokinase
MINLIIDNKKIDTGRITFSDGAYGFDLKDLPDTADRIVFSVDPSTKVNTILDELTQLNNAIPEEMYHHVRQELFIPYLPYGRADRKFSVSGNFGLLNFALNLRYTGLCFDKVIVVDPHNHEAFNSCFSSLFGYNELEIITQRQALAVALYQFHIDIQQYDAIVSPDKGAVSKAQEIADYYQLPLIVCTKQRDPATGKLSNPVVNGDVAGKKLLIVDDIGDGNGTFIQLATELQKQVPAQIDLYVTHLIGSRGLDILRGKIDNVFCYQTVAGYLTMQDVYDFNSNFNLGE